MTVPVYRINLFHCSTVTTYSNPNLSLSSSHVTLLDNLTPHICLIILISALNNDSYFSSSQAKFHCHVINSFLHFVGPLKFWKEIFLGAVGFFKLVNRECMWWPVLQQYEIGFPTRVCSKPQTRPWVTQTLKKLYNPSCFISLAQTLTVMYEWYKCLLYTVGRGLESRFVMRQ